LQQIAHKSRVSLGAFVITPQNLIVALGWHSFAEVVGRKAQKNATRRPIQKQRGS